MEMQRARLERGRWARAWDLCGPVLVWAVWVATTAATLLYIRQNARNIPYRDDFALVGMMTGHEQFGLPWLWAQHNEHRPVISRLILAGLSRFVKNDFQAGRYFSVGLLSAAAASMLVLARRLRGSTSVTDAVLPLAMLNLGQAETLMITFAMNLVVTAWIAVELIAAVGRPGHGPGWPLALRFGLLMVLLPLSSGGGLVMLPPLIVWLACYVAWGCWSGRETGGLERAIGLAVLMACSSTVALYLSDFYNPPHHGSAPSLAVAAATIVEYLSLTVWSVALNSWWPAGLLMVLLIAVTVLLLARVAVRAPAERPWVLGLIAILLAMLSMAAAVGLSRSGFGPGLGRSSRYVTLTAPLLCALYIAWLAYGPDLARRAVHVGLLTMVCLSLPANIAFGGRHGTTAGTAQREVEWRLKARVPASKLMRQACPLIFPDLEFAYRRFMMLKEARFGAFESFHDDRMAAAPDPPTAVR